MSMQNVKKHVGPKIKTQFFLKKQNNKIKTQFFLKKQNKISKYSKKYLYI
jgi:hypothetical protein